MFLEFFGLREQPFGMTPDPAYLYASKTHSEALAALSQGIAENRGFFALIAQPGMGKTTLLYHLLEKLRDSSRTVLVFQTQCTSREFLEYILQELGVDIKGLGLVAMHGQLNEILFEELLAGKRFVLVVDEAQNLDDSVLETVRMLSNFETHNAKLLQIILAGQPRLAARLAEPELSQLRQRIAVLSHLEALTAEETGFYIAHRLKVAGYVGDPIFDAASVQMIARQSDGIPRIINNFCYHSLFLAYTRGHRTVTAEIVQEVFDSLDMEPLAIEARTIREFVDASDLPAVEPEVAALPAIPFAASPFAASIDAPPALPDAPLDESPMELPVDQPFVPLVAQALAPSIASSIAPAIVPASAPPIAPEDAPPIAPRIAPAIAPTIAAPMAPPSTNLISASNSKETLVPVTVAPAVSLSLTYGARKKFILPKWHARSAGVALILFTATLFLAILGRSEMKQRARPAIVDHSADAVTPPSPADQPSDGAGPAYEADPQNTENGQIITVMAGPQQTLKDLTMRYVGHYDSDLSSKIASLNPDLKDPDHLEAGQLIRIPLPPGAMKKVNDTAETQPPPEKEASQNLFTKLSTLLHMRNK